MPNLFQKIKIIAFFAVVILAILGLASKASAAYLTSGNWTSVNLLSGESVSSIDSFVYNLSAKPENTGATIQFSQDNSSWYNSSGVLDGTDTLTTGVNNTINLPSLGWSSANFYYKVIFTSDGTDTPVLDDISVYFTVPATAPAGSGSHTPPTRYNSQPTGTLVEGTTQTTISLETDEPAICKYSTNKFTPYYLMTNTFSAGGGIPPLFPHSSLVTGLSGGNTYHYYVKCLDNSGNVTPDDFLISFSVADTTPPVLSNSQPTGTLDVGTTQTNLSLTTNESATCRYSSTAGTTYDLMPNDLMPNTFSTTGGISHAIPVTSLNNGNTYNYYIRCSDTSGNKNTADFTISFGVTPSPTLFVVLTANTSSGQAPLDNIDLTAAVSGTATGRVSYYFYCNRSDSNTSINFNYNDEYFSIAETSKTAKYVCDYPLAGIYYAKTIVRRGQKLAESRVEITVTEEVSEEVIPEKTNYEMILEGIQVKVIEIQQKIIELFNQLTQVLEEQLVRARNFLASLWTNLIQ